MKLIKALPPILLIVIPFFWEALNIKLIGNEDATLGNITVTYGCLGLFFLIAIINYKTNDIYFAKVKPLVIFNVVLITVYILQIVFSLSQFLATLNIIKTFLFSLILIMYFSMYSLEKNNKEIKYILWSVVPLFIIQFVLSAWESYLGVCVFGGQEWINKVAVDASLNTRIIFSILAKNLMISHYFIYPFSGLLGQWNNWGTQLPIYNLIFWFLFLVYKKNIVVLFIILTLFASILNTSRFGIITIILTDLIMYIKFGKKSGIVLFIGIISLLGIIYINLESLSVGWTLYFEGTNTLLSRFELYDLLLNQLKKSDIISLFLGAGTKTGDFLVKRTSGQGNSFENEFFAKLFLTGIFGFTALIVFLFSFLKYFREKNVIQKYFGILLFFNIVAVSVIANCIFNVYIFSFVTILYIVVSNYEVMDIR